MKELECREERISELERSIEELLALLESIISIFKWINLKDNVL